MRCYYIAKKKDGLRLGGFYPNDLPTRTKQGVTFKNIFKFSRNNYMIFNSIDEAIGYLNYMFDTVCERMCEYKKVHWASEECLRKIILKELKVYDCEL